MVAEHLRILPHPGGYTRQWRKVVELAKDSPALILNPSYGIYINSKSLRLEFQKALDKRIILRGPKQIEGLSTEEAKQRRIFRHLSRTVICECRWCGNGIPTYTSFTHRFCDANCRQDFYY